MLNLKKILFIITISCLISSTYTTAQDSFDSGNDLRYEHAKLAYKEHKFKKALAIIEDSIIPGGFHTETYLLLGDIYIKLNYPQKALKAYYYVIKKNHEPEILSLVSKKQISQKLSESEVPQIKTLETYLKIGIIWYKLFLKKRYEKPYQTSLLRQAEKYFFICNWYKYNPKLTTYYLALTERDKQNHIQTYKHFKSYKKISKDNPYADAEEEGNIDFLIADTLLKAGKHQKASVYLRSLREDNRKSTSLREYANSYMESMHLENWSLSGSLMGILDSNIHNLTSEQKANFEDYEEALIQKHAFMWRKNVNFHYASKRFDNYSYNFIFQGKEDLNLESEFISYDTRDFSIGLDLVRDSFKLTMLKLKYQYHKSFIKQSSESGFMGLLTRHNFTPKYIIKLAGEHNMGQLIWGLPISFVNNSITKENTTELGLSLSYKSLELSTFFAPIYAVSLKSIGEGEDFDNSTQFQFSVTNLFSNFEMTNILLSLDYLNNTNSEENLSYIEINLDLTASREIETIKNLYLDASLIRSISNKGADNSYSKWKIYLGLSYSI